MGDGGSDVCVAGESCPGLGPAKVPVTLAYVLYDQGDIVGLVMAWFSLFPVLILVGFVTLVAFHRDLHTLLYFVGVILNVGLNFTLKHIIKDPRPTAELPGHTLLVEYGMPSSHAQFMAFFAAYFIMFVFIRVVLSSGPCDYVWKSLLTVLVLVAAIGSCAGRVYLGYHSVAQIMCGVGTGCGLGVGWFLVVHLLITPLFPFICSWRVSIFFLLKDSYHIPNYMWFEYTSARLETRKRIRTKST